jgi:DNA-binding MarR family transcriptional regulator
VLEVSLAKNSTGELKVTDVQIMYADLREAGYNHHKAIRELARTLGVDPATARTVLERAEALNGQSYQACEAK